MVSERVSRLDCGEVGTSRPLSSIPWSDVARYAVDPIPGIVIISGLLFGAPSSSLNSLRATREQATRGAAVTSSLLLIPVGSLEQDIGSRGTVTIDGEAFAVEVADEPNERQKGPSGRRSPRSLMRKRNAAKRAGVYLKTASDAARTLSVGCPLAPNQGDEHRTRIHRPPDDLSVCQGVCCRLCSRSHTVGPWPILDLYLPRQLLGDLVSKRPEQVEIVLRTPQ